MTGSNLAGAGKSEITNLDVISAVDAGSNKDVVWFQIAVHHAHAMDMNEAGQYLTEQSPDLGVVFVEIVVDEVTESLLKG